MSNVVRFAFPAARPDWDRLNLIVLDYEHLPVVLARLGLRVAAVLPAVQWWSALGPVVVLADDTGAVLYLDADGQAGWRDGENVHRGPDLASLAAHRWRCGYGRAAHRLARICQLPGVPTEGRRHGR